MAVNVQKPQKAATLFDPALRKFTSEFATFLHLGKFGKLPAQRLDLCHSIQAQNVAQIVRGILFQGFRTRNTQQRQ
jgi:hypothetical protein